MAVSRENELLEPGRCALVFAIPTSREAFFSDVAAPEKELAKLHSWGQYYREVISVCERVVPAIKRSGVQVYKDGTAACLTELFEKERVACLVLFAHWMEPNKAVEAESLSPVQGQKRSTLLETAQDACIELSDGPVTINEFVQMVPGGFRGVIDLCVCHPAGLAEALAKSRPNCDVKHITKQATPRFWLFFYLALFKYLERKNTTYQAAVERIFDELRKTKERGRRMANMKAIVQDYVARLDIDDQVKLGPSKKRRASKEDSACLINGLRKKVRSNRSILVATLATLLALSITGFLLILHYRNDPKFLGMIFGALYLSHLGIVARLRELWIDKNTIDIALPILTDLPPEKAAEFMLTLYWGFFKTSPLSRARSRDG